MEKGFLILPRNYFESFAWQQTREYSEAEAWLDIIRSARYDSEPCTAIINEKSVTWTRGEWPVSLRFLANRWQWSIRRVRTFMTRLCRLGLVTLTSNTVNTIVQVVDYDKYCGTQNDTLNDTQSDTPNDTPTILDNNLTTNNFQRHTPSMSTQQETCNRHTSDTPNDTKKNKDINYIFINNNHAHAQEKNQTFKRASSPASDEAPNMPPSSTPTSNEAHSGAQTSSMASKISSAIQDEVREMSANESWKEAICMRHHITPQQLDQHLEAFSADCICCGRSVHNNMTDAYSHFHHWLRIQLQLQNSSSTDTSKPNHHANNQSKTTSADLIREAQQWAIHQSQELVRQAAIRHSGVQEPLSF